MKIKFISLLLLFCVLISTTVLAANITAISSSEDTTATINKDLFIGDEIYSLKAKVLGNVFGALKDFSMDDTTVVNGNLYIVAQKVNILSDVSYSSDKLDKDGTYSVETINKFVSIYGNVFIVSENFILEAGSKIDGDLYIVSKNVTVEKSSSISGNAFIVSEKVKLDGKINNSIYATCDTFDMSYFGSISKDLNLSAKEVNLNSVVHRDLNIDCENLITGTDFINYGNSNITANTFKFSGEIDGNATIKAETVSFINKVDDSRSKCLIKGNLEYSSNKEIKNVKDIVSGKINYLGQIPKEIKRTFKFDFKNFILGLLAFVVYNFVIYLIIKWFAPKYVEKETTIAVVNSILSFLIGLLVFILTIALPILLFITRIGVTLGFICLFAFILLLFLALPLFVLDIAKLLKGKLNIYLLLCLIPLALYLISYIPYLGGFVMFLFITVGSGRIVFKLFKKLN